MYLGVDYYPEHWPKEMVDEDLQRMQKMGANLIRIGEFAWHLMEKEEGKYDFSFFDEVIKKAKKYGMKIMFGTPTATFPAWLAKKHPSILSKFEDGNARVFGGRRQYCFNSEHYQRYAQAITRKLAEHYHSEEAVIAWQIDNEFGHEGSDMCYCENCHERFQYYLKQKYESIERLNETYGTIFWGQTYNHFSEIPIPKKTITHHNPSLLLDWSRFRSDSLNDFTKLMADTVRRFKGEHQGVTTNISGGFFEKWFDHSENVEGMDFVSYDNYPVWGGLQKPVEPEETAMSLDFIRGLQQKPFWIAEELMGMQGHTVIGYLPRPGEAKMWSYQAFAHGCSNMLYFRWRGMTRGAEQYCYGILDHDNSTGRKYLEVQQVFQDIPQYAELLNTPIESRVAVLYDYENIWSWRHQPQNQHFDFKEELLRLYRPFFQYNVSIDVIPVSRDFSKYDVVLVPCLQMIEEDLAERFRQFSSEGGTLVFSFRTGIKNRNNNILFGKTLPGYVKEIAGIEIHDSESLFEPCFLKPAADIQPSGSASVWRDMIVPAGAETLYFYDDDLFGYPSAITKNQYGKGTVYYIGCGADEETVKGLGKTILEDKGIWHLGTEKGLEVYSRSFEKGSFFFIMNHTDKEKSFRGVKIKPFESKITQSKP